MMRIAKAQIYYKYLIMSICEEITVFINREAMIFSVQESSF